MRKVLENLSSLKLTVALLSLSMFLTLAGTLAQVNQGIWTVVDLYFRSIFVLVPLQIFMPEDIVRLRGAIPFPGGLTLGVLLFVNLTAAFVVRFTWSPKRIGVIISHAGVILLLVGEYVTCLAAKEGNKTIDQGETANYLYEIRTSELAIVESSDSTNDTVTVIPQGLMDSPGKMIEDSRIPFTIRINEWMPNSGFLGPMQATQSQLRRADTGLGRNMAAIEIPAATGVDGANVDVPSAYMTLSHQGKEIGTYLFSVGLTELQSVKVGDKEYQVALRFERTYKPYTISLIDFRHDKFVGTNVPRNFSSQVRIQDPARNTDREALIYMNNPLRYAGDTLYQASFKPGDKTTILQVVTNPGWLLPYISCAMVTLGLLIHFGMRLAAPIRRNVA
ncbi:MAG: cytochrome c biogenesis protein ResB [bacterium]